MSAKASPYNSVVDVNQLRGWLPIDAVVRNGQPGIQWMDMKGVELREPMFHQTVARLRKKQFRQREIFTGYETLIQFAKTYPGRSPAGFIFHASRCGSTGFANACCALDNSLVIAEACAIDKLIGRFFTDVNQDRNRELLYSVLVRAAISTLGQTANDGAKRYFVKFSCCSVLQLARITRIWPDVPWIFVYRDPLEILVSNLQNPPEWMDIETNKTMASALLEMPPEEIGEMAHAEFCARVVSRFYSSALQHVHHAAELLNYENFSFEEVIAKLGVFGIAPTAAERESIARVLKIYSKDSNFERTFVEDTQDKRAVASKQIHDIVERWALEPYLQLERKRHQQ